MSYKNMELNLLELEQKNNQASADVEKWKKKYAEVGEEKNGVVERNEGMGVNLYFRRDGAVEDEDAAVDGGGR